MSDNSRRNRPPPRRSNRNEPSDWSEADDRWLADQMDIEDFEPWHETADWSVGYDISDWK